MTRLLLLGFLVIQLSSFALAADRETEINTSIIYVKADAMGANDGTSWANAFTDLPTAITSATSTDEIWVASGTYKPTNGSDVTIDFPTINGMKLYGGFAGTEVDKSERNIENNPTVLSGDLGNNDSGAPSISNSTYTDNSDRLFDIQGSGFSLPIVIDGFTLSGSQNNTILINEADGRITIANCLIENNLGDLQLFYIQNSGNQTKADNAELYFESCIIRNNSFGRSLVYNSTFGSNVRTYFINSLITGNTLSQDVPTTYTSLGLFASRTSDSFSGDDGGNSAIFVVNSTVADNNITDPAATLFATQRTGTRGNNIFALTYFDNSISWNNGSLNDYKHVGGITTSRTTASFSKRTSITDEDPGFVTKGSNPYYLNPCSPAYNTGNLDRINEAVYTTDLDGSDRVFRGLIDMGAFEYLGDDENDFDLSVDQSSLDAANEADVTVTAAISKTVDSVKWTFQGQVVAETNVLNLPAITSTQQGNYQFQAFKGCFSDSLEVSINVIDTEANFLSFSAPNTREALIDEENQTVLVLFPINGTIGTITPNFTLSSGATSSIPSGTSINLSTPVSITLTAEDGSTALWEISGLQSPIYVDADAAGNATGTTWGNAFTSFNEALANAGSEDEVWVAGGSYTPNTTDASESFLVQNGVEIYGGFTGTETTVSQRNPFLNKTILTGDIAGNDSGRPANSNATYADNTETLFRLNGSSFSADILIDGFTISGSKTEVLNLNEVDSKVTFSNCTFEKNLANAQLILAQNSGNVSSANDLQLVIANSIIRENSFGNSLSYTSTFGSTVSSNFINCLIVDNDLTTIRTSGAYASLGMFVSRTSDTFSGDQNGSSSTTLTNCTVTGNNISDGSAAIMSTQRTGTRNGVITIRSTLNNTILWDNSNTNDWKHVGGTSTRTDVLYSPSNSILNTNPIFESKGTNPYYLAQNSPAVDAGDNNLINLTAYPSDLANDERLKDASVDIGAFEFQGCITTDFDTFTEPTAISSSIDYASNTVTLKFANGTDLTALTPTFTTCGAATSNIASGAIVDLSQPVVYTLTDGAESQSWTILVTFDLAPEIVGSVDNIEIDEDSDEQVVVEDVLSLFEDPEGSTITVSVLANTLEVSAEISQTNQLSITPATDYFGSTAITLTAADEGNNTTDLLINVTVVSVNDAPAFTLSGDILVTEDFLDPAIVTVSSQQPANENNQTIAYTLSPETLPFATISIDPDLGTITLAAIEDGFGSQVVTVTANDAVGETGATNNIFTQDLQVTVSSVNDNPEVTISDFILLEDFDTPISSDIIISQPENETEITSLAISPDPSTIDWAQITFDSEQQSVSVEAIDDAFGEQIFTLTADDGETENNIGTTTFLVSVAAVNDAPVFELDRTDVTLGQDFTTTETIQILDGSPENETEAINYSLTPASVSFANVSIDSDAGEITITSVAGASGSQTFNVNAFDGEENASASFELTVLANQAPVIVTAIADQTLDEDFATLTLSNDISSIFSDPDGDQLSYAVTSDNSAITASILGNTLELSGQANYFGSGIISVSASDQTFTTTMTFMVTVNAINDAPEIVNQPTLTFEEDASGQSVDLSTIFSDVEDDPLTYTIGEESSLFAIMVDGAMLTLTPNADQFGSTLLAITATDGESSTIYELPIIINAVNDAPRLAGKIFAPRLSEDQEQSTLDLTSIFSDVDGDVLSYTVSNSNNIINATIDETNQLILLDLNADANGSETLSLVASDGELSTSFDLNLNVAAVNDAPTFSIDRSSLQLETGFETQSVILTADDVPSDEVNQTVTYSLASNPIDFADVSINPNSGQVTINAIGELEGSSSFTIIANDGEAENNLAEQSFTIEVLRVLSVDGTQQKLAIYPNPTQAWINIESDSDKAIESTIYTLEGKEVLSSSTKKIDISTLKTGNYVIRMINDQKATVLRFIKE